MIFGAPVAIPLSLAPDHGEQPGAWTPAGALGPATPARGLWAGLRGVWPFGGATALERRRGVGGGGTRATVSVLNGGAIVRTPRGWAMRVEPSAGYATILDGGSLYNPARTFTLLALAYNRQVGASGYQLLGRRSWDGLLAWWLGESNTPTGVMARLWGDAGGSVDAQTSSGLWTQDTGVGYVPGAWSVIGVRVRAGAGIDAIVNGAVQQTAAMGDTPRAWDTLELGLPSSPAASARIDVAMVAIWNRALTAEELRAMQRDPFRLVRPGAPVVAAAAGGGGGTGALLLFSNQR